ncbi:MAG TPA: helix-turn-helix domain-containing protein [Alphaproteobacteria bacterium]|nr:helix-turn-helix domain-containing protein [Alphaproteobacteria bacterium]
MSIGSVGLSRDATAPIVVKPRKACEMLGCGITRLYELLNGGELESYKDGGSRKITVASIHRYIGSRVAAAKKEVAA